MRFILLLLLCSVSYGQSKKIQEFRARAKREGWTFHFSDHSKHGTGLKKKSKIDHRKAFQGSPVQIPDQLDLRPTLSPIQDQGSCGSCWAFSLTATLRDGYRVKGKDPGELSPQYLVDCAINQSGCGGGYFDAAQYLLLPKGSPSSSEYPYVGVEKGCEAPAPVSHAVGWHMLGGIGGPSQLDIESYMAKSGRPVSITIAAGIGPWSHYDFGIYNACETGETDHMINLVGWDNEGETFGPNGNLPPGVGVWILRNSWGTSWGEEGWMRIRMTDAQGKKCNAVAEEAMYLDFDDNPEQTEQRRSTTLILAFLTILTIIILPLIVKKKPTEGSASQGG